MSGTDTYFKDHWVDIEQERLDRYGKAFRINDANRERLVEPLGARPGETVVDFGCGPGDVSIELARIVGPSGLVHAFDLNEDLLAMGRASAERAGMADRIRFHQVTDESIDLPERSVDRVVFKSVLLYVPDVDAVLAEAVRVLRPGGQVAAQDSDFWLSACTAFDRDEWRAFLDAVRPAFADPTMGRNLRAALMRAGLSDVTTTVSAMVDDRGFFRATVENFFGYARAMGTMSEERLADLGRSADAAISDGRWLFVLNFFQCNGTK
jgi:ubiquinone/menaquinone biosynthesis C-methylase UbiE